MNENDEIRSRVLRERYPELFELIRDKYGTYVSFLFSADPESDPVPKVAETCLKIGYLAGQRDAKKGENIFAEQERRGLEEFEKIHGTSPYNPSLSPEKGE